MQARLRLESKEEKWAREGRLEGSPYREGAIRDDLVRWLDIRAAIQRLEVLDMWVGLTETPEETEAMIARAWLRYGVDLEEGGEDG